jgi:hypothetical protein
MSDVLTLMAHTGNLSKVSKCTKELFPQAVGGG